MLTILCGEDIIASRQAYGDLEQSYRQKNFQINHIQYDEIFEINKWLGESVSLFSEKQIFFTQDISRKLRRGDKRTLEELEKISKNKQIEVIDWEQTSARDLKIAKLGIVREFKPSSSIFKLMDSLYPTNLHGFIRELRQIADGKNDQFIFIMLIRHVRLLLLSSNNAVLSLPSWQVSKLRSQAARFQKEKLVAFYEALFRLECSIKTSSTPFSLPDSLDILACHFL